MSEWLVCDCSQQIGAEMDRANFTNRPNEVFVRTPQPQYAFNGDMFSSFSDFVVAKPESQLFQSASNANVTEAFDPFARETTLQKPPAVRRVVRADGFQLPSR